MTWYEAAYPPKPQPTRKEFERRIARLLKRKEMEG